MMKNLILFAALTSGVVSAQAADDVQSIEVATHDVSKVVPGCNLTNWMFVFCCGKDRNPTNRLKRYRSVEELVKDTEAQTKLFGGYKQSAKVNKLIIERIQGKIDFSKRDLVIVKRSTGGPPFGTFREQIKDGTAYFWTARPVRDGGGASGLAMKMSFDFFSIPKGLEVKKQSP